MKIFLFDILFNQPISVNSLLSHQLVKFGVSETWEPVKFDVSVPMPESLDLSVLRSAGPQPGETVMPEPEEEAAPGQWGLLWVWGIHPVAGRPQLQIISLIRVS